MDTDAPTMTRARMWERHADIAKMPRGPEQDAAFRDLHLEYTRQFVTPAVRNVIIRSIGLERIKASRDSHFNDIPLHQWDHLEPLIRATCNTKRKAEAEPGETPRSYMWSLSDAVSIAKVAAHDIRAEG